MYSIGVDIGGSHITCGMFEHSNKILKKETIVSLKVDTKGSMEEIINTWVCAVTKTIALSKENIKGIGVAMPGPFDYYNGISLIKDINKLDSLYNINIRNEMAFRLKISPCNIRFINDATAFSIAEAKIGKASAYQRSVAITLGTGLGSSFLIDGKPMIKEANVPKGGFLYNQKYRDHLADDFFSTRGIINKYKEITGNEVKNVFELCKKASDEKAVLGVFKEFGLELGKFLKPYLKKFDAEVLVIGGNIAKASNYFIEDLSGQLPQISIHISDYGEEAAIIGSALLLDDHYYADLKPILKSM